MNLKSPIAVPPDPLAGPRTIGDAADYFKIDPANGRISAAGTAQAMRCVPMLGTAMHIPAPPLSEFQGGPAWQFVDGVTLHLLVAVLLPAWVDTASEMTVVVPYSCTTDYSNTVLRLSHGVSSKADGVVAVPNNVVSDVAANFNTPSSAPASHVTFLDLCTIPADSVAAGEIVQLDFKRLGDDANDTLEQTFYLITPIFLRVKQKELA
jgi:hypothetical protein